MIIKRDDGREFLMVAVDEIRAVENRFAEANASDRPEVDEGET